MDFSMIRYILLVSLLVGLSIGAYSNPASSPSAFGFCPTDGIDLSPTSFASGQLSYTLTLSSGAYRLYMGNQYPILDIWGFYAVNKSEASANNFTASGPDDGEWINLCPTCQEADE